MTVAAIAINEVRWEPCFRIVSSRFPPIDLFERVADPADWDALYWLESLTNSRLRDAAGEIELVPPQERVCGPNASVIMAPFTHLNPEGSRFADNTFGAFYAAATLATAIAETRYHREQFLRATAQPPTELDMRCYLGDIAASFHDLRGCGAQLPQVYDPHGYAASQNLARDLKRGGSNGVVYDSVRDPGGECVAVYRPHLIHNVRQGMHLRYIWNGARVEHVYELRLLDATTPELQLEAADPGTAMD